MLLPGEKETLEEIDKAAKQYGYGNIIAFLKRKWADMLSEKYNMPDEIALAATDESVRTHGAQVEEVA